jgi:hypothetical protein
MLLDLESAGNAVRYVAPMFHRSSELNEVYLGGRVLQTSLFISPLQIGELPDDGYHHVAFTGPNSWCVLSEPRRMEKPVDFATFSREIHGVLRERGRSALSPLSLGRLRHAMISIIHERRDRWQVDDLQRMQDSDKPLRIIAYLSRTFFGCELLIVREGEGESPG